jgi:hypothetical protein
MSNWELTWLPKGKLNATSELVSEENTSDHYMEQPLVQENTKWGQ